MLKVLVWIAGATLTLAACQADSREPVDGNTVDMGPRPLPPMDSPVVDERPDSDTLDIASQDSLSVDGDGTQESGDVTPFDTLVTDASAMDGSLMDVPLDGIAMDGPVIEDSGRDTSLPDATQGLSIAEIALGGKHACVRGLAGAVRCWGMNAYGQLGDGTSIGRSQPTSISLTGVAQLALGDLTPAHE